ncbi:nucleotidyltransferase domain-containing protein [Candidatus Woesearchaeota archaeon]|nr:nucleotidyltransferase domain-containing protein [Candidatus Woesearchaeota archaeon]
MNKESAELGKLKFKKLIKNSPAAPGGRDIPQIEEIKNKILKLDTGRKIKFIYLFGSQAGGKSNPLSDIDIAIYYNGKAKERFEFRIKTLGNLPDKVDLQIFQDLPLAVKREIIGGKVLYWRDYGFLFDTAMAVLREFGYFEKYYNEYFETLDEKALT